MALIYADQNGIELGMLTTCEYDFAFGEDENDFSVTIDIKDNCCNEGFFIYADGTEYGGIVDRINPDTNSGTVTYEGRTWHGILNGKVIEPSQGKNYKKVSGDANEIIAEIIAEIGLSDVFSVSSDECAVNVKTFKFDRYTQAYSGILKMLYRNNGKLQFTFENGKVQLEAVPLYDFTLDEEWNSKQINFSIKKNYRPVNHLICLGQGDLKERKVIHLFADENGGILPYKNVEEPVENEDYILTKENQVLFGKDEVTSTYDYGNAETVENYVALSSQPSNWKKKYTKYYQKQDDVYMLLEQTFDDVYSALTSKPSDWSSKYANYFTKSGSSYRNVEGVESDPSYTVQSKEPSDWEKQYSSYFYYYSDGTRVEYRKVVGDTEKQYNKQTMKPSDWEDDFRYYYERKPVIVYKVKYKKLENNEWNEYIVIVDDLNRIPDDVTIISIVKNIARYEFVRLSGEKAPKWVTKKFYTEESYKVAPKWEANKYYTASTTISAPTWTSGKYYKLDTDVEIIPTFKPGEIFKLCIDEYADLVDKGIERFNELLNCDSIDISLDSEQTYDINDVVGACDEYTGISVYKRITKKIVTVKDDQESIQYEIGE